MAICGWSDHVVVVDERRKIRRGQVYYVLYRMLLLGFTRSGAFRFSLQALRHKIPAFRGSSRGRWPASAKCSSRIERLRTKAGAPLRCRDQTPKAVTHRVRCRLAHTKSSVVEHGVVKSNVTIKWRPVGHGLNQPSSHPWGKRQNITFWYHRLETIFHLAEVDG